MATAIAFSAVNMESAAANLEDFEVIAATSTYLGINYESESFNATHRFYGEGLTYSSNAVLGGTITTNYYYENGAQVYAIFGGEYSAVTVYNYLIGKDATGLFSYIFAGSDQFSGSVQNDVLYSYSGDDKVEGHGGDDLLKGGDGKDTLDGGDGNDSLFGGQGEDTALFSGNISDYVILDYGVDPSDPRYVITNQDGSVKDVIREIEWLSFDPGAPIGSVVSLERSKIYVELLKFSDIAYKTQNDQQTVVDGWRTVYAPEIGLLGSGTTDNGLQYTFINGVYNAQGTGGALTDGAGAHVYAGVWEGKNTLVVAFRGTDTKSVDFLDYPNFQWHYDRYQPLIDALEKFIKDPDNDIQQVFVTGHSLGGAMAQMFMQENLGDSRFLGATFGSPGAPMYAADDRLVDFANTGDPVPYAGYAAEIMSGGVNLLGLMGYGVVVSHLVSAGLSVATTYEQAGHLVRLSSGTDFGIGEHSISDVYLTSLNSLVNAATNTGVDELDFLLDPLTHPLTQDLNVGTGNGKVQGDDFNATTLLRYPAFNDGSELLVGSAGADSIYGYYGSDTLFGGAGLDILDGGSGKNVYEGTSAFLSGDRIVGMAGGERIRVLDPTTPITSVSFDSATGVLSIPGISAGLILGPQSTASNFFTTIFNDPFTVELNSGYIDILYNGSITRIGNALSNLLWGGTGNDTLDGGAGDDDLIGGSGEGDDLYIGGDGLDTIHYTSTKLGVVVNLATGLASGSEIDIDQLTGIENVIGGIGNDSITGSEVANVLYGELGEDHLEGGNGDDVLYGGDGNDTLSGQSGNDTIDGFAGIDAILYSGMRANYNIVHTQTGYTVTDILGTEGTDILINVEHLQFADDAIALDNDNAVIYGTAGNDTLSGLSGNDTIDGLPGIDTVLYSGSWANFEILRTQSSHTITDTLGTEGTDTLLNIERLEFADAKIALDIDGNAGMVYRLYEAAFNRTPDKLGLAYWIGQADAGLAFTNIASAFTGGIEFQNKYGTLSNNQFIEQLYLNILDRQGEAAGLAYWQWQLNDGFQTREEVLIGFSESYENQIHVIGQIENGIDYTV